MKKQKGDVQFKELYTQIPYQNRELFSINQNKDKLHIIYYTYNATGDILQSIHINFMMNSILSYLHTDESERFRTISQLLYEQEHNNLQKSCIYEIKNSDFIRSIKESSKGKIDISNLKHYLLLSDNDVIDILSLSSPHITYQ